MLDKQIRALQTLLDKAHRVVFLTGAGISTESGVPDFRSTSGIYSRGTGSNVFDINEFYRDPRIYYRFAQEFCDIMTRAQPNAAHLAIADLGRQPGKQVTVVTQNIDDLHQRAGSDPVWCVHGNLEWSSCLSCRQRVRTAELIDTIRQGEVPRHNCGGVFKPEVTFFGEMLPQLDFLEAQRAIGQGDLLIVVGSSLVVYPAAGLPFVRRKACSYVIINRDPTDQDHSANLVIHASAGQVLSAAIPATSSRPPFS